MPSVRYYNQTAPFWDWVSDLEGRSNGLAETENERDQFNPWTQGWATFPFGPIPHRARGPVSSPPPQYGSPPAPPTAENDEVGTSGSRGSTPPLSEGQDGEGRPHEHHHHGPRRGGPEVHSHFDDSQHHGPRRGGSRGPGGPAGRCGRARGGPEGRERGPFHPRGGFGPLGPLAEMFQSQLFGNNNENANSKENEDFKPEVDVFDTADSFVVHVSLPGAKKEDLGVNWDAEKSELNIAGVIYRPGDEELLKTLALDERKIGAFERKIRLGSRANPAQVDVDSIVARLEDGILRIEVPKQDAEYVEIKKVDIE